MNIYNFLFKKYSQNALINYIKNVKNLLNKLYNKYLCVIYEYLFICGGCLYLDNFNYSSDFKINKMSQPNTVCFKIFFILKMMDILCVKINFFQNGTCFIQCFQTRLFQKYFNQLLIFKYGIKLCNFVCPLSLSLKYKNVHAHH